MRFRFAFVASAFLLFVFMASTAVPSTQLPRNRSDMTAVPAFSKAQDARDIELVDYQHLQTYLDTQAASTTSTTTEPPTTTPPTTQPPTTTSTTEAPTPPPPTDPAPTSTSSGSVEDAIATWFGDIYQQAWNVSGCESGHDPGAVSPGGGNYGLFQINSVHRDAFEQVTGQPWSSWSSAYYNAQYARSLYDQQGWGPWACKWAANR